MAWHAAARPRRPAGAASPPLRKVTIGARMGQAPSGMGWQDASRLRALIGASQAGSPADHAALLTLAAGRARGLARASGARDCEAAVQQALRLIHALRRTYHPSRCPLSWLDALIGRALSRAPGVDAALRNAAPPAREDPMRA